MTCGKSYKLNMVLKEMMILQVLNTMKNRYRYWMCTIFRVISFDVFWKKYTRVTGYKNCQRNKSSILIIVGSVPLSQNQLLMPTIAITSSVYPKYLL